MGQDGLWQEIWMPVKIDVECTNEFRLEISNLGRVRSFNKISNGNILKGSLTEGYKVLRLKLFKPRTDKQEAYFESLRKYITQLFAQKNKLPKTNGYQVKLQLLEKEISTKKEELSQKLQADLKKRTINYPLLFHRLVAQYFLPIPTKDEKFVTHLDHDKLNNRASNLKWMTQEEQTKHQNKNPKVIAAKIKRREEIPMVPNGAKLSITQVMFLKKLLNEGKDTKQLKKQFKVSEAQILRIKRGENWAHIKVPD